MDPVVVGSLAIVASLVLLAVRVPVAVALGLTSVIGYLFISSPFGVWYTLGTTALQIGTEYTFSVIPLFVLMGALAVQSGMTDRLFSASTALFGRARGSEAMATIAASAALGAVSGSSLATTATMSRVAGVDLLKRGYSPSLVGGAIAAGGTLGILIPPSVVIVIYALITGQSVAHLFAAGLLPGLLLTLLYIAATYIVIHLRPGSAPPPVPMTANRLKTILGGWEVVALFSITIGGIYLGWFTPSEAASVGVALAFVIGFSFGRLTAAGVMASLRETVTTAASLFFVVLGATFFAYFIIQARVPVMLVEAIEVREIPGIAVILLILAFYLVAGCFLDGIGMMLATVPVFFPVVVGLGYDPIWFGILVVVAIEVGLITPPIGMNIFVIKGQLAELGLGAIYRGVIPYVIAQIILLALLLAIPGIATFLPDVFF